MKGNSLLLAIVFLICVNSLKAQVTDKDGNNYTTVKIGVQQWMAENLNVCHFRNGDTIPEIEDAIEWKQAGDEKKPAWCYYNNDSALGTKYHKLYNWYAINDPRGLAPDGWHIPSTADWSALTDYLGGENVAGIKIKTHNGWDGNNASGLGALPGGYRNYSGEFKHIGGIGSWWSSTEADSTEAWTRSFGYGNGVVSKSYDNKREGSAVRCIRDN